MFFDWVSAVFTVLQVKEATKLRLAMGHLTAVVSFWLLHRSVLFRHAGCIQFGGFLLPYDTLLVEDPL